MMDVLSEISRTFLLRAGWFTDRSMSTDTYEQALKRAGYIVHECVLEFLRVFGGLHVNYPHFRVPSTLDECHFDPLIAIKHTNHEGVEEFGNKLGCQFCVIGEAREGYYILVMNQNGQVFAFYGDFEVFVGESGIDAINNLCEGKDLQVVSL